MSREGTYDTAQVCKNGNPEMFLQELTEQGKRKVIKEFKDAIYTICLAT